MDLANDKNHLVQTAALNSLIGISEEGVKDIVLHCMHSIHPLVRGYAYCCLSELNEEADKILQQLQMVEEKNTWAKIILLISEARLGAPMRIQRLLSMYPKCNYYNRATIAEGISDIFPHISSSDQDLVRQFVNTRNKGITDAEELEAFSSLSQLCNPDI